MIPFAHFFQQRSTLFRCALQSETEEFFDLLPSLRSKRRLDSRSAGATRNRRDWRKTAHELSEPPGPRNYLGRQEKGTNNAMSRKVYTPGPSVGRWKGWP